MLANRPSVREMLDQIDAFLVVGDVASRDLWAVLTALRGPDMPERHEDKVKFTIPIRRQAFPLVKQLATTNFLAPNNAIPPADFGDLDPDYDELKIRTPAEWSAIYQQPSGGPTNTRHFDLHITEAVRALQANPGVK